MEKEKSMITTEKARIMNKVIITHLVRSTWRVSWWYIVGCVAAPACDLAAKY